MPLFRTINAGINPHHLLEKVNAFLPAVPDGKPEGFMSLVYHAPILDLIIKLGRELPLDQDCLAEEVAEEHRKYQLTYFATSADDSLIAHIEQRIVYAGLEDKLTFQWEIFDEQTPSILQHKHFVSCPGTLVLFEGRKLLFRHGQSEYQRAIARENTIPDGDLTHETINELMERILRTERPFYMKLFSSDDYQFHHKRLMEVYACFLLMLKDLFPEEGSEVFHKKIDSLIAQFKLAYAVVAKGKTAIEVYREGGACSNQMKALNDSQPEVDILKSNTPLDHWSDVLLARLMLEMRRQIMQDMHSNSTAAQGVYLGYKNKSDQHFERLDRQFRFSLHCYQLSEALTDLVRMDNASAPKVYQDDMITVPIVSDCHLEGHFQCETDLDREKQDFSSQVVAYATHFKEVLAAENKKLSSGKQLGL